MTPTHAFEIFDVPTSEPPALALATLSPLELAELSPMAVDLGPFLAEAAPAAALQGFHMVTAVTQDTLNFQLKKLWKSGVIRRDFVADAGSLKLSAQLGAPRVVLGEGDRPGTLLFLLHLTSGTLTYWDLGGDEPVRKSLAFTDWTYAFRVNMNFVQIAQDAALNHTAIPVEVKRKLTSFTDADFTIRSLFMDFQNADIASLEPDHTVMRMPDGADVPFIVLDGFRQTLTAYFKRLGRGENPYILGYSVERKPASGAPALFEPTGATFSTFQDAQDAGLNCLNFLLMTRGEAMPVDRHAGRFTANWVESRDYDGRMVIDGREFREQYLEKTLLPQVLRGLGLTGEWRPATSRAEAQAAFGIDDGQADRCFSDVRAEQCKVVFRHTDNFAERASDGSVGYGVIVGRDSDLTNIYREDRDDVACTVWVEPGPELKLGGSLVMHRDRVFTHYPLNIRTALAWIGVTVKQRFSARLVAGKEGRITVEVTFAEVETSGWSGRNAVVWVTDFISAVLGLPRVEEWAAREERYLQGAIGSWMEYLRASLVNVLEEVQDHVILPAGEVFFYKNIVFDEARQAVLLDVSYKTEHVPVEPMRALAETDVPAQIEHRHELMTHHVSAAPIRASSRIAVAQDSAGEPILFTAGEDGGLYLVRRQDGGRSGWELVDITPAAAAGLVAGTFEISESRGGEIYVAASFHPANEPDAPRLFVSPRLTNNHAVTDWAGLRGRWVERKLGTPGRITRILLGTSDDGQGAPLAIAAIAGVREATHVRFNADASDATWSARAHPLPENAKVLHDLAIGTVQGDRGVFALYSLDGRHQTLQFSSLPDPEFGKIARYDYALPARAAALSVVPNGDATDLYVAGDGLHAYVKGQGTPVTIASPDTLSGVESLAARSDGSTVALWARRADGRLEYVEGSEDRWSRPVVLDKDVAQFEPLRSWTREANQLFTVSSRGGLRYRWQDAVSGVWNASDIALPDTGRTLAIPCYASHLTIRRDGMPAAATTLDLTASGWTYAIVNGQAVVLEAGKVVQVRTDFTGQVTILQRVEDLAAQRIVVASPILAAPVTLDPTEPLRVALAQYRTADDLRNARMRDGRPLFATAPAPERLDAAAVGIQRLLGAATRLQEPGRLFAAEEDLDWGLRLAGGVQLVQNGPFLASLDGDSVLEGVGHFVESLLAGLTRASEVFWTWLGNTLEFAVDLGGQILRFLVKTAQEAYKVLHWVLKETLGLDLDTLTNWLGFVFSWPDILRTQKVLANVARQSFAHANAQLGSLEAPIHAFFGQLRQGIADFERLASEHRTLPISLGPPPGGDRAMSALLEGPGGSWATYQYLHGGIAVAEGCAVGLPSALIDTLKAFVRDILAPVISSVGESGLRVVRTLQAALVDGTLTVGEVVLLVGKEVLLGFLDVIEKAAVGALAFVGDLLTALRDMVDEELQLPVLTGLYRELTEGGRMSVLEGLCFLCAVPATAMYKLATGQAPFVGEAGRLATMEHEELFAVLRGEVTLRNGPADELAVGAEAVSAATVYSYVGGFAYAIATFIHGAADMISAATDGQDSPPSVEFPDPRLKKFWLRKEILQVGLSTVRIASSFPVGVQTPSLWIQRAVWGLGFPLLAKDAFMLFMPEKFTGSKVLGGVEVTEAVVEAGACVTVFVLDVVDTGHPEYNLGVTTWMCIESLIGALGGASAGCTRLTVEPSTKAGFAALAGGCVAFVGLSNGLRNVFAITQDIAHYNR